MQGAIDGTHVHISKPETPFTKDLYYSKRGMYSIMAQAIVYVGRIHGRLCWTRWVY